MMPANIAHLTEDQIDAINKFEKEFIKKYGQDIVLIAVKR